MVSDQENGLVLWLTPDDFEDADELETTFKGEAPPRKGDVESEQSQDAD